MSRPVLRCSLCDACLWDEYGQDFLGRLWCLDCALVADVGRQRRRTAGARGA